MNAILQSISFMVFLGETFASSSRFSHQKCGLYGMPPCNFVPSTSGVTPVCAGPGKTYCEYVPNYPVHAVRLLLDKWGIDNVNDLIVDETVDDFEATRFNDIPFFQQKPPDPHQTPTFTEPPNVGPTPDDVYHNHNDGGGNNGYNYPNPNNVHTVAPHPMPPAPAPPSSTAGYLPANAYTINHNPGANRYWSGFSYSINQRPTLNYNQMPGQISNQPYSIEPRYAMPQYVHSHPYPVTAYHPARWLNRYIRDVVSHHRLPRHIFSNSSGIATVTQPTPLNVNHLHIFNASDSNQLSKKTTAERHDGPRRKRQSNGREQLCQTTYQYITPQAALNSQGNWMYIVNQVDTTRQLVRTETCASSVCSNICQLPNGYTSRCEQKYVQKRLIAINADGTNLYTDTFWFPSCCACTIAGPT